METTLPARARIWTARRDRGLSQARLAELAEMDQGDVSRIERGWIPPPDMRQRLAAALDMTVDQLFGPSEAAS